MKLVWGKEREGILDNIESTVFCFGGMLVMKERGSRQHYLFNQTNHVLQLIVEVLARVRG